MSKKNEKNTKNTNVNASNKPNKAEKKEKSTASPVENQSEHYPKVDLNDLPYWSDDQVRILLQDLNRDMQRCLQRRNFDVLTEVEVELAYVQREIEGRRTRADLHDSYLDNQDNGFEELGEWQYDEMPNNDEFVQLDAYRAELQKSAQFHNRHV